MVLKYNPKKHQLACFNMKTLMKEQSKPLFDYFGIKDFSYIQHYENGARNILASNIEAFESDYQHNRLYGKPIKTFKSPTQLNDHLLDGEEAISFFYDEIYQSILKRSINSSSMQN